MIKPFSKEQETCLKSQKQNFNTTKNVLLTHPPACTREEVDYAESIGFTKINGKEEFIILSKDGKWSEEKQYVT